MSDLDEARVVAAGMRAVIDVVEEIGKGWGIPALREINFDTPWQKLEKAIGNRHERRARKARAK